MEADLPAGKTAYSITFKSLKTGEVLAGTFPAGNPDDAVGAATDHFCRQLGLLNPLPDGEAEPDPTTFNDEYRLVRVAAESAPPPPKKPKKDVNKDPFAE